MKELKEKFERITFFKPAFDKRDPDPHKDYGIGCVRCIMVLKGKKGATSFIFGTGMYLEDTHRLWLSKFPREDKPYMGYDIGYHSLTRQYKGQSVCKEKCDWIGKRCYSDGSSLRADEIMEVLVTKGSEAVWKILEEDYNSLFKPKRSKPTSKS